MAFNKNQDKNSESNEAKSLIRALEDRRDLRIQSSIEKGKNFLNSYFHTKIYVTQNSAKLTKWRLVLSVSIIFNFFRRVLA